MQDEREISYCCPSARHSLNDRYSEMVSSSTTISSTFTRKCSHTPGRGLTAKPTQGGTTMASCNSTKQRLKSSLIFLCVNLMNLIHVKVVKRILHVDSECFSNPEIQILYPKLSSQWMMEQRVIKGRVVYETSCHILRIP